MAYDIQVFPFNRPKNYDEVLNKIGAFTFFEALALTCLVARAMPSAAALLGSYRIPIKVFSIEFPLLYVLLAAATALVARIVRLHDKLSDVFGVRKTFDLYRVLIPLAGAVGLSVDNSFKEVLKQNRGRAMQRTFYQYASFEDPQISRALVLSAIDVWTWYWVLSEFLALVFVAGMILLIFGSFGVAAYLFLTLSILTILFNSVHRTCGAKADHQIEEIVSNAERVSALQEEFGALRDRKAATS